MNTTESAQFLINKHRAIRHQSKTVCLCSVTKDRMCLFLVPTKACVDVLNFDRLRRFFFSLFLFSKEKSYRIEAIIEIEKLVSI